MTRNRKYLYITIITILAIIAVIEIVATYNRFHGNEKVHYHAGFVVFQDGKKLNFSDLKYMDVEPCTTADEDSDSSEYDQIEKAHLHDGVGDVVHVERKGAIWQDLFANIKFPIDYTQTRGYIDGKQIADFELQSINQDDSLVIFIGNNNDQSLLSQAVTKEYIETEGEKSESCKD